MSKKSMEHCYANPTSVKAAFAPHCPLIRANDDSWSAQHLRLLEVFKVPVRFLKFNHVRIITGATTLLWTFAGYSLGLLSKSAMSDPFRWAMWFMFIGVLLINLLILLILPVQEENHELKVDKLKLVEVSQRLVGNIALLNAMSFIEEEPDKELTDRLLDKIRVDWADPDQTIAKRITAIRKKTNADLKENDFRFEFPIQISDEDLSKLTQGLEKMRKICADIFSPESLKIVLYMKCISPFEDSAMVKQQFLVPIAKFPGSSRMRRGVIGDSWLQGVKGSYVWQAQEQGAPMYNDDVKSMLPDNQKNEFDEKMIRFEEADSNGRNGGIYTSKLVIPLPGDLGVLSLYSQKKGYFLTLDPCSANSLANYTRSLLRSIVKGHV